MRVRHTFLTHLRIHLLLITLCACSFAFGNSLAELAAQGRVRIDSVLSPSEGIVPGQRVKLTLQIATDTWFSGGTRIRIPEIPGLVILQTEQFASNASETRNGTAWALQRWTLDIYPQRAGEFTIGPIVADVQVSAGENGAAKGELHSPSQQFRVAIPDGLAQATHWVAAPAFSVSQSFDRALDNLAAGDAIEQEVLFEASDVLAMMLPGYEAPQLPGLAAYPSPPVLENSVNRGQTLARRTVRISYVVEQPGQYLLPARDYLWWNTQTAALELVSLPATRINVSAAAGSPNARQKVQRAFSLSPRQWLALVASLVLGVTLLRLVWLHLPRLQLAHWRAILSELAQRLRSVFKPALATRLNPGSSAED